MVHIARLQQATFRCTCCRGRLEKSGEEDSIARHLHSEGEVSLAAVPDVHFRQRIFVRQSCTVEEQPVKERLRVLGRLSPVLAQIAQRPLNLPKPSILLQFTHLRDVMLLMKEVESFSGPSLLLMQVAAAVIIVAVSGAGHTAGVSIITNVTLSHVPRMNSGSIICLHNYTILVVL